jgi:Uri superfamily endonuclease
MKIDASLVSELSTSGVYTLILFLSKEATVTVGRLGKQRFPRGYYVYTGSALGKGSSNLKHRIARHLRKEKRRFWHIDYLLADENVSVEAVVAAETNKNMECSLNSYLKKMEGAKIQVNGFGASDCRKNCGSHLLYFPETKKPDCLVQKLVKRLQSSEGILSVIVID